LVGAFLIVLFLPEKISLASLLILAFSDPAATLVGKRFGKIKWRTNPEKSVEGSLAMFLVSLIILFSLRSFYGLNIDPLTVLFVAFSITLTEVLPLKIGDNIIIPLLAGMVMVSNIGNVKPDLWLLLLILLGVLIYLFGMLDLPGTFIAIFFALLVILSSTPQFLMALIDFLVLGFLISRFKYKEKKKLEWQRPTVQKGG
jgi:Dolichol kinase